MSGQGAVRRDERRKSPWSVLTCSGTRAQRCGSSGNRRLGYCARIYYNALGSRSAQRILLVRRSNLRSLSHKLLRVSLAF